MIARWGLAFALLFSAGAFAQQSAQNPDFEAGFKKHLGGKRAKAVRERYLERVLKVRYRTQAYLDAFEKDLRKGLPLAEMKTYANFLAMHPVQEEADEEGIYIYRRLLETAWSNSSTDAERRTSLATLDEIYNWIKERPEEDRIVISDWIDRVEDMYKGFDNSMRETETQSRKIASALPTFNFSQYNFGHQNNLSQIFKKHADDIQKNAASALKWKDPTADAMIAVYNGAIVKKREIASTIYKASEGPEGNFDGERMAPQTFAFTFDDGPGSAVTDRILDIATGYKDTINQKGVPLTFFSLVENALRFPVQIARIKSLGFMLNNHSWTHPKFNVIEKKRDFAKRAYHEVVEADQELRRLFGVQPVTKSDKIAYYRCPYGSCIYPHDHLGIPAVRKLIADLGEMHINWAVDSADWANNKRPERTRDITIAQMERWNDKTKTTEITHGVILMHDIPLHPRTPDAFRMVLEWIKQKNAQGAHITLVSVADAIAQVNGTSTKATP